MKRILVSLSIIGIVAVIAIGATVAYYGDTETSKGNTMTAGTIDLKIDLQCPGTGCNWSLRDLSGESFFHECDIKPGDSNEVTISWHVYDNNAWARIKLADLVDYENKCTSSEGKVDTTCGDPGLGEGELDDNLIFTLWMDEGTTTGWQCPDDSNGPCKDDPLEGDNILNGIEKILAEKTASELVAGVKLPYELEGSTTYYLGLKWTIPAKTGNIIQTDSLGGKIVMEIVQSRNNPNPWPTPLINGGFETGNTTGWTVIIPNGGTADVVSSYIADEGYPSQGPTYNPVEGNYFLVLKTDGPGSFTSAKQSVAVSAGQKIKGWAAYDAIDYLPFEDDAYVKIYDSGNNLVATPWHKNITMVGDYGESPWEQWIWTAPSSGTYTVELKINNTLDSAEDSRALFDANVIQ